jgi:hypothetical protein
MWQNFKLKFDTQVKNVLYWYHEKNPEYILMNIFSKTVYYTEDMQQHIYLISTTFVWSIKWDNHKVNFDPYVKWLLLWAEIILLCMD